MTKISIIQFSEWLTGLQVN